MTRQFWIVIGSMAAGLILVAWLGWQFVLRPVGQSTIALQGELKARQDELDQVKGAQAQYEKFKRDAEATRHEVQVLRQRLDPEITEGELLRLMQGLVLSENPREATIEYTHRAVSKIEGQTGLDEVLFKVKMKSDYESVGRMLNGLLMQMRLVCPEKIQLKAWSDTYESRYTVDAQMEFKVYLETKTDKGKP